MAFLLAVVLDNTTRSDHLYAREAISIIEGHDQTYPLYLQVGAPDARVGLGWGWGLGWD